MIQYLSRPGMIAVITLVNNCHLAQGDRSLCPIIGPFQANFHIAAESYLMIKPSRSFTVTGSLVAIG